MTTQRKNSLKPLFVLILAAVVLAAWGWFAGWFRPENKAQIQGARVERGPLTISVLQRGNLAAKDATSIKSEIEGQTTILWLITEGTIVKPGDLLVELDASDLLDKKVAQDIAVQNAEAAYTKAQASFDIQESQNKSDIEAAERKLTFADIDRKKYLEGDFDQLQKAANEKIKLAESELAKAKNTFDWSKNLSERGFLTKSELDRDELDFQRAQITLEQATRNLDLLQRYDDPRRRTELDANYREAERGLERARLQAQSRLVDYEAARATSKSKLDLEKEKLTKYVDQIAKARIVAKDSGMVVYARSEGGGRMGGGDPIQEGTTVRERQEILTIPRTQGLIVEASVHESVLKRVTVGNRCKIRADAQSEREFEGTVRFVAPLADKNSWWANPNQRLYRTEISVTDPSPELRPGMSCSIDILADFIPDCLSVPLQAIILDKGKTTVFVVKGDRHEQREVTVGRSNDAKVEVLTGLVEAEEVLLAPPPGFTPQAPEETNKGASEATPPAAGMPAHGALPGAVTPPSGARGDEPAAGRVPSTSQEPGAGAAPAQNGGMPRREGGAEGGGRRRRPNADGSAPRREGAPAGGGPAGGGTPGGGAASGGTTQSGTSGEAGGQKRD